MHHAPGVAESRYRNETNRAISDARTAFSDAIGRGDTMAAASLYSDEASLVAPSADLIVGRQSIEAFWRAGVDSGVAAVDLQAFRVEHQDRMAYEIGRYVVRMRSGLERPAVDRGRYVLLLERRSDGSWCRTVEMFSPDEARASLEADRQSGDQH